MPKITELRHKVELKTNKRTIERTQSRWPSRASTISVWSN